MTEPFTCGVHHIGLTVPDLEAAQRFFCELLGWSLVRTDPDYPSVFVSDGHVLLTLWRAANPRTAVPFDRRANIGLHHLALTVEDDGALDALYATLHGQPDVTVEFAPTPIAPGSDIRHFICAMPGGVRIEFATPAT